MPASSTRPAPPRARKPGDKKTTARKKDPLEADFGPGQSPPSATAARREAGGPIPGLACAGEGCVLKPVADLTTRFALQVARGHIGSLSRAAFSAIELMKALRDFLDEEIQMAEKAAGRGETAGARYVKIAVE
ncbi:MAG: hypothetical protein ABIT01_19120 [Thermoanaerobaculia bacterium]